MDYVLALVLAASFFFLLGTACHDMGCDKLIAFMGWIFMSLSLFFIFKGLAQAFGF